MQKIAAKYGRVLPLVTQAVVDILVELITSLRSAIAMPKNNIIHAPEFRSFKRSLIKANHASALEEDFPLWKVIAKYLQIQYNQYNLNNLPFNIAISTSI